MTFASTASGSTIRHAHATAHTVGACRRPRCKSTFNLGNLVSHYAPLDFTVTVRHVSGSGIGLLQDNSACHISPCMRSSRIIMWDGRTYLRRWVDEEGGHAGEPVRELLPRRERQCMGIDADRNFTSIQATYDGADNVAAPSVGRYPLTQTYNCNFWA